MAHLTPLLLGGMAVFALSRATKKRRRKKSTQKVVPKEEESKKELPPETPKVVSSWLHRQEALRAIAELGICDCDPGNVDGKYGPETKKAVEHFQRHVGLEPTGYWDEQSERQMLLLLRSLASEDRPDFPTNGTQNGNGGDFGPDDILVADPQCNYMRHIADEFFEIQRKRAAEYALEGNTMGQDASAIHQEMVEEYMPLCASLGREGVGPGVRTWWDQNVGHIAGILSEYEHLPESLEQDAQRYGLI